MRTQTNGRKNGHSELNEDDFAEVSAAVMANLGVDDAPVKRKPGRPRTKHLTAAAAQAPAYEAPTAPEPKRRGPGRPRTRVDAEQVYEQLRGPLKPGEKVERTEEIRIPELDLRVVQFDVEGLTSLIVHKFSEKSRRAMERKQQGEAVDKKAPKNPETEYESCFYFVGDPRKRVFGFPAAAFKKAAISACRHVENLSMSHAKGSFHILDDLCVIRGDEPIMRTDTVRVGGFGKKVADIRYRPEFKTWSTTLTIRYNASAISPAQIAHLLNVAGFAVGVGEWRPEKDGSFGQFSVAAPGAGGKRRKRNRGDAG